MPGRLSFAPRPLPGARLAGQCEVCRQWSAAALCEACTVRFAPPVPRCRRCATTLGRTLETCGDCLRNAPPFGRTLCVADYGFPWDRLIGDFKFNGRVELARVLGRLLAEVVRREVEVLPDLVVPVPLALRRLRERGYNQAWALARAVAGELRLTADAHLLQRPVDTPHQADLDRAHRLRNLRAAFMVEPRRRAALHGRRVALVDDVMTTGTTAREACGALLRAGAAGVELWVVARTPAD